MGTGYVRNDTSNNIADGNIINAADLDGEFDAIESAMGTSGHTHDGTSAEGGPVTVLGPVQDFVASATEIKPKTTNTLDIGTSGLLFKDMFLDGVATIGSIKIDNAGTIGSASDGDAIAISSGGVVTFSQAPVVDVTNSTTNAVTDVLDIQVQSTGTPAVGIGSGFTFGVETAAGNVETGGAIRSITTGLTPTAEEIDLVFYSMRNGSLTEGFRYDSSADNFDVTGSISIDGGSTSADFTFGDNDKAIFGAGSDLQIYAASGVSFIKESGAGNLNVNAANFILNNADDSQNMFKAKAGAEVELYYNNSQKLETTSTGVDITGTLVSDGLTVDATTTVIQKTGDSPTLQFKGHAGSQNTIGEIQSGRAEFSGTNSFMRFKTNDGTSTKTRLNIDANGDISFFEDTGTTAKFFWDASAENLNIGTTTGTESLSIKDTAGFQISFGNTSASSVGAIGYDNNDKLKIYGNGATRMTIDSSGNVGIGTSSPSSLLHVYESGAGDGTLKVGNAQGGDTTNVGKQGSSAYGATSAGDGFLYTSTVNLSLMADGASSAIKFSTGGNTERMRIDSSGNVLVGTTSAYGVGGATLTAGGLIYSSVSGDKAAEFNRSTSDGDIVKFNKDGSTVGSIGTFFGNLMIGKESGARIAFSSTGIYSSNNSGTTEDASYSLGTASSRFTDLYLSGTAYVSGSGVVGRFGNTTANNYVEVIRTTTSPSYINIGATSAAASIEGGPQLKFSITDASGSGSSEAMRIDSSGNVGIGLAPSTSDPLTNVSAGVLQVDGNMELRFAGSNVDPAGARYFNIVNTDTTLVADQPLGGLQWIGLDSTNPNSNMASITSYCSGNAGTTGDIRFKIAGSEAMRIDSSGNVGIGLTPSSWWSNMAAVETQASSGGVFASASVNGHFLTNAYYDGSNWKYKNSGFAEYYSQTGGTHQFLTASSGSAGGNISWSEAMRIDSSGNLLVGTTDNNVSDNSGSSNGGINIQTAGVKGVISAAAAQAVIYLNRLDSDGDIAVFRKDGATVGSIGVGGSSAQPIIGSGNTGSGGTAAGLRFDRANNAIEPWNVVTNASADNIIDLGFSSIRFDDIYATNGTIQTSDRNEKQDIAELSDAEQRVAVAAKGLLRKFRWKDKVAEKGDEARTHFGIIAQDLQAAFAAEGLDAGDYAMFISSTWTDEETGEERTRMGVRYSELLAFIIAAI